MSFCSKTLNLTRSAPCRLKWLPSNVDLPVFLRGAERRDVSGTLLRRVVVQRVETQESSRTTRSPMSSNKRDGPSGVSLPHICGGVTLCKLLRLFPHTPLSWCFLRSLPLVRTETLSFLADGQWSGVDLDWDERRCPNTSGSLQDKHQAASQRLANTQSLGLYMETMEEIRVCVWNQLMTQKVLEHMQLLLNSIKSAVCRVTACSFSAVWWKSADIVWYKKPTASE